MKKLAALLLASASLGLVAAGCGGGGDDNAAGTADMAVQGKKCEAGYIDARLPWGRKCLVHGQYCRKSRDQAYHRFGLHCHTSARLD